VRAHEGAATSAIEAWVTPRAKSLAPIAVGVSTFTVAAVASWALWPEVIPRQTPVDRVLFAIQLMVVPTLVLHFFLNTLWRLFDSSPGAEDPFAGAESQRWKTNARIFQNSIEQWLLFVPVLLGLAIRLQPEQTRALPMLVTLWSVGRIAFWVGYHIEPRWRAPGMDWTTGTSVWTVGWFLWTLIA
jgi:hypothetical protein